MTKKAVILHGLQSHAESNWFPWLKTELERHDYEVWLPEIPGADHPVGTKWVDFLMRSSWDFNQGLVIGHSAGAVAALYLAQTLPQPIRLRGVILVSAFLPVKAGDGLHDYLKDLHDQPFNYARMQAGCDNFLFVHSDNDQYAPLAGAQELAKQTAGQLEVAYGAGHFSAGEKPQYTEFPYLLELMQKHLLL